MKATYIKTVYALDPENDNDDQPEGVPLDVYVDHGTGYYFAVESDWVEDNGKVFSPFSKNFELDLRM